MKIVQIQTDNFGELYALSDDGRIYKSEDSYYGWREIPGPQALEPATDYKAQRDELAGLLREAGCFVEEVVSDNRAKWGGCLEHKQAPAMECIARIEAALAKLKDTP